MKNYLSKDHFPFLSISCSIFDSQVFRANKFFLPNIISLIVLITIFLTYACSSENVTAERSATTTQNASTKILYSIFEEEQGFNKKEFPNSSILVPGVPAFPSIKPEDFQRRANFWRDLLMKMKSIKVEDLSKSDKINYDMFKYILEDKIAHVDFKAYLTPVSGDGGFHVDFVYMKNSFSFQKMTDYQKYLKKLEGFKDYCLANIELMRMGLSKGKMLPKVVLQGYESYIDPHIVENPEESFFYEPFEDMIEAIPEKEAIDLKEQAKKAITESVVAGYQIFKEFIQKEYRPQARETVGISEQPQGKEFYQQRIEYFTTLPLDADKVFEIGEQEVARIKAEMEQIISEVGFDGSFADFLNFLRTDPQFYAKTGRELLMHASYLAKKADGRLPKYFNKMPRLPYGVAPVPDAIAPKYTGGRYSPGSAYDHKAGFYWVNTYKLESRPLFVLPALTLHEAAPGHHLQIALAEEMLEVPEFRKSTYLSCYGEGWALYCEWLGKEMGMYETPYQDFGRLTYEMWRACRLVVDVGLHAKGWSRQQAVDFMASNSALSMHEVNTEIDRYIGWPGQAISYKIGELKIRELRKKAEAELGANFDLRAFHDVILLNGAVPLFILEELVDDFIEQNR